MKNRILRPKKLTKKIKSLSPKTTEKKKPRKADAAKKEISFIGVIALSNLKAPHGSHKRKKILGRGSGSGHGKTSTRGSKGQTSRSGSNFYAGFEGGQTPLIRRIPKRGFVNPSKKDYQIVNLRDLSRIKEPNITLELLEEKGLIKNKEKLVKVLGEGKIQNSLTVQAHAFSKKAAQEIKNAGGQTQLIHV